MLVLRKQFLQCIWRGLVVEIVICTRHSLTKEKKRAFYKVLRETRFAVVVYSAQKFKFALYSSFSLIIHCIIDLWCLNMKLITIQVYFNPSWFIFGTWHVIKSNNNSVCVCFIFVHPFPHSWLFYTVTYWRGHWSVMTVRYNGFPDLFWSNA